MSEKNYRVGRRWSKTVKTVHIRLDKEVFDLLELYHKETSLDRTEIIRRALKAVTVEILENGIVA